MSTRRDDRNVMAQGASSPLSSRPLPRDRAMAKPSHPAAHANGEAEASLRTKRAMAKPSRPAANAMAKPRRVNLFVPVKRW
ncbi:hypothetical protein SAMN05660733_04162 [Lentzea albidocapillata]|uniref:Uncharacterized protein n=1 Tax=Lentzea albidocapillata TaxID=40571 RepID=A0A1W2EIR9_9PSEU|nr:hypothetical protein SAMN05660733_04162 [Lentzea albidocapillata]